MSIITNSDGDDLTDYTASIRTYDTLDELLTRFTLEFKPEYVIKLRNRLGPLIVGADAVHFPEHKENLAAILIKPVNRQQWWRRLRIDTTGSITLRSRKLRWWLFTLDLEGCYNPLQGTTDASFRVATKWDLSRGEYKNKKRIALGDATEGRLHWNINYNLPEVAGSFGSSRRSTMHDVHAEVGYAHAEVSKVEVVVWPWRNNPRWKYVDNGSERSRVHHEYYDNSDDDDQSNDKNASESSGGGGAVVLYNNNKNSSSGNNSTGISNTTTTNNTNTNTTHDKECMYGLRLAAHEHLQNSTSILRSLQNHIIELKDGLLTRGENTK